MANKWLSSGRYGLTRGLLKRLWAKYEYLSIYDVVYSNLLGKRNPLVPTPNLSVVLPISSGVGQTVASDTVVLAFDNILSPGDVVIEIISSPSTSPVLPNVFSIDNNLGIYRINTTATFVGEITLCFEVSEEISEELFNSTRVFHSDSLGVTYDATILSGASAPNYPSRTICALVDHFSEFFIIPASGPIPTATPTETPTETPTATPTAAVPISPLSLANGFLSALRSDTVNDSEFPNAALANGFLSVLRVGDNIPASEFPNAALANGYLSTLHTDTI